MNPNCSAASRYSPVSEQRNIAGSSEFNTIGTPASNSRRTGMVFDPLDDARDQIAGDADFQRNIALAQVAHQRVVTHRGDPVADAFGAKREGVPDGFRPHALAGVRVQVQSCRFWRTRRHP